MFRTILIKNASKLQSIQGYLIAYDGDHEQKVFLDDISTLIIEATGSIITIPLMIDLIKRHISVVFCDQKHNPVGTVLGLDGHYSHSGNLFKQLDWSDETAEELWGLIIKQKILMQSKVMSLFDCAKTDMLLQYHHQTTNGDKTNREGLSAKVYFNELYGKSFHRDDLSTLNGMLNYGYAIILSCVNREIVSSGYLTQLGIFHKGKTNPFNLSSDFMEPFRPIVDLTVKLAVTLKDPKRMIRKVLTRQILVDGDKRFIDDAIRLYVMHFIRFLNHESKSIPKLDLLELDDYRDDESHETDYYV